MYVELQLILLFVFAVFWSLLYELKNRGFYCAVATIAWWVLSGFWLYAEGLYMPLAYLPLAIGWIYFIRFLAGLFQELRTRRWSEEW